MTQLTPPQAYHRQWFTPLTALNRTATASCLLVKQRGWNKYYGREGCWMIWQSLQEERRLSVFAPHVRCPKRLETRLRKQLSLAKKRLIQELMELLTGMNAKQR